MAARIIDRGRGPELEGTRVTVYRVMDFLREGCPHQRIATELDLTAEQVAAAVQFIEGHRAEVEAEYAKILQRVNQPNPAWVEAGRAANPEELRQRLLARSGRNHSHAGPGGQ